VANYQLVKLTDPDALCLDGTPGAYYIFQGGQKQKFLLSFEGGGWCGSSIGLPESLEDCLGRSNSDLGSSAKYGSTWQQWDGILSDNALNSYRDWTIVYLKYCDGTGHQGYKKDPILYKDKNLYFRGHNVTIGQLNSLESLYGLSSATDIVVTGQSAGGLATFLWTSYIADRASKGTRVISLPDSGIFLDSTNYITKRN
jgi:O-palmitoleoyl-L-serine hydrolase